MTRNIPGTNDIVGREFFYIEIVGEEGFDEIIDKALSITSDVPLPKAGGVIEEKARLLLADGQSLLAMSYKGDLAGWRARLVAFCNAQQRKWGIVSNNKLVLSIGSEMELRECAVAFEE